MKIIGLDVGTVRIGVARADTSTKIAIPDGYINVNGQEVSEISRRLSLYNSSVLVLGLPRSNQGNQTAQSEFVKDFARRIAATIPGLKIYFQDESLTSVEAEKRLKSRKTHFQKGEIDTESAAIILQDFIERLQSSLTNQQPILPEKFPEKQSEVTDEILQDQKLEKHQKKKGQPVMRKIIFGIVTIACLLIVALFGAYFWLNQQLKAPQTFSCTYNSPAEAAVGPAESNPDCLYRNFEIKTDETIDVIVQRLYRDGLIRSEFAFKIYLRISNKATKIKAGSHYLRNNLSAEELATQLENGIGSSQVFSFTVLPGETIRDVKEKLIKIGYTSEQIESALLKKYTSPVLKGLYDGTGKLENQAQPANVALEGYLYGETYQFYQGETVEHIFETMINQLNSVVALDQIESKLQKRGFTLREGIILASIIQKESHSEDMAGVSMVFQNRLKVGMNLGSDVTATYAADLLNPNRDKADPNNNLRVLETDSLYNTRRHTGLPPGPICSPSLSALLAVASPDESKGPMYYFLTGDDGKMYYSVTGIEHEQKKRDFCQKLCNVGL